MKPHFKRKLKLIRVTIAKLDSSDLNQIFGGDTDNQHSCGAPASKCEYNECMPNQTVQNSCSDPLPV